ncbi:MAG: FMN-binding glutamate synthase family protein [Candidatus Gracilibacteria bacterium]|nr:FMN-binding glutamate synthase family protein [Candidatus Gracilibacteria bacterium]
MDTFVFLLGWTGLILGSILVFALIYDRFFQRKNLVIANFPLVGRFRYLFHELRPLFRQYFGDDDSWVPRIIIDWILSVSEGKTGYFSFDKFDTTEHLHDGHHQMVHSPSPLNEDETKPLYPTIGPKRKHPLQFQTFFYRSAMSLGSIGFEATTAMSAACVEAGAAFNTGEGSLSIHHLPRVKFSKKHKWMKFHQVSSFWKVFYRMTPGKRMETYVVDFFAWMVIPKERVQGKKHSMRDLYLFDEEAFVFYTIDWSAPLEVFPKPEDLSDEYGRIIFQVGSGMYGLRKKKADGAFEFDFDRFQRVASFCRAIEIKLAQGAKQTGGILKASKNTPVISEIRGVHPNIDLVSPNRFPFLEKGKESEFFDFLEKLSDLAGGKPVGMKIVVSDEKNIEGFAKALKAHPKKGPDFITLDGGDGGSATAPIALGILFGRPIYEALVIANKVLNEYGVRDRVKVFASSKLYAPHMSARAMALGADAIGNARSIMIAGGCIRAGLCSGEKAACPVGMATLNKSKTRSYAQTIEKKISQISNYITAHNKGLIQVAAICGLESPHLLSEEHLMDPLDSMIQIGH